jgi:SAM-dependent methyltransferase
MSSASRDPYTPAQAASWDGYYGSEATGKSLFFRCRLTLALELLDEHLRPSDGPVADLGCGAGQLTTELFRRGFAVTALDYSAEMLRLTERKLAGDDVAAGRVSFIRADLNVHELPRAQFAAVCALGCLEFLRDVPAAIAKLTNGVRPGGYFLLSMPNVHSPFVWPEKSARLLLQMRRTGDRPGPHHPLSRRQVEAVMRSQGFAPVGVRFTFPATLVGNFCFPPMFCLRRLAQARSFLLAPWLANTWVALFRKT